MTEGRHSFRLLPQRNTNAKPAINWWSDILNWGSVIRQECLFFPPFPRLDVSCFLNDTALSRFSQLLTFKSLVSTILRHWRQYKNTSLVTDELQRVGSSFSLLDFRFSVFFFTSALLLPSLRCRCCSSLHSAIYWSQMTRRPSPHTLPVKTPPPSEKTPPTGCPVPFFRPRWRKTRRLIG